MADSTAQLLAKPATDSLVARFPPEIWEDVPDHRGESLRPSTDQDKDQELSKQLQDLSKAMLELLNEEDPLSKPHAQKYLAETYKSEASIPESGMKAETSSSHFANIAAFRKINPEYHVEVYNTTAHVNRETGRAMVWATSRVSGLSALPPGAVRESVTAMHWRKQTGGFWELFRTTSMRGPGDIT